MTPGLRTFLEAFVLPLLAMVTVTVLLRTEWPRDDRFIVVVGAVSVAFLIAGLLDESGIA